VRKAGTGRSLKVTTLKKGGKGEDGTKPPCISEGEQRRGHVDANKKSDWKRRAWGRMKRKRHKDEAGRGKGKGVHRKEAKGEPMGTIEKEERRGR